MNRSLEKNDFYRKLFKKFDKTLTSTLDHFSKSVNASIQKVESRLKDCEETMQNYIDITKTRCENDLVLAEVLVNKELRSKIIMSQWTNKFVAATSEMSLDPISFALARFSLNLCISYNEVFPDYYLKANIHKHLIDYISLDSELVAGPSLMALTHISIFPSLRSEIVSAGVLPALLKLLVKSQSKPIISQAAKLCASLSLEASNKSLISQSGCMHAIFDLILGAHVDVDRHIQYAALSGIVNLLNRNDANRMLAVELNGIKPILTVLRSSSYEDILVQAIYALANIAYGNGYTANCILVGGGGEVLVEILESGDIIRQPMIAYAVLAAFSNICNNEVNQSHIGSIKGLIDVAIRICQFGRELFLISGAANFLLSSCWKNKINKARIANRGGCLVLVRRISMHSSMNHPEHVICSEHLCNALSSVLLYPSNHERMTGVGALEELVRLCKVSGDPAILRSIAKVIVTMVPTPADLLRVHADESKYPIESLNGLVVLKRVKLKGFSHLAKAPDWLEYGIKVLSSSDSDLECMKAREPTEFVEKTLISKEFSTEILPDASIFNVQDFRGLLFSIY